MRIGVLTGGGDCPGLNAVIRAIVRKGVKEYGYEFIGFRDGWKGPLENLTIDLDIHATRFGLHAITAVHDGKWGRMVALHSRQILTVPLKSAISKIKTVDPALYKEAEIFFG